MPKLIGSLRALLEEVRILGLEKKTRFYQASTFELYGLVQEYCSIRAQVISGLGSHPGERASTHPSFYSLKGQAGVVYAWEQLYEESRPVEVGNDVWIGSRALLLDGIKIGDGAIAAAGSVVAKNVPPYGVVGSVPARLLKYRFCGDIIEALLKLRWWDWPEEKIRQKAHLFSRPEALLEV